MFATALALVTFVAAPVPKGAETDRAAALQGEWKVTGLVRNGTVERLDPDAPEFVTFAGDTVRVRTRALHETGTFTVSARNDAARIDITRYNEDEAADGAVGVADDRIADARVASAPDYEGLYALDRDVLTIYLVKGQARPAAIPAADKAADGSVLLVLTREKKK
jgi:uncharacterized protein (TIGR03067 family)